MPNLGKECLVSKMYSDDATVINDLNWHLNQTIDSLQAIENACILYLQQTVKGLEMSDDEKKRIIFIRDLATEGLKKAGDQ